MQWLYLYVAIAFDICGTLLLRMSYGFEKMFIGVSALAFYFVSFIFLSQALKIVPVGITYAIWSGLGTTAVAILGVLLFKEHMSVLKLLFIGMIITGCVGLNLFTKGH